MNWANIIGLNTSSNSVMNLKNYSCFSFYMMVGYRKVEFVTAKERGNILCLIS
jgi:hypothetical protein